MQAKMNQRKTMTWSHFSGASNIEKIKIKKRRFRKSNRMALEALSHKPSNKAEVNEIHFLRVHQQPYWY